MRLGLVALLALCGLAFEPVVAAESAPSTPPGIALGGLVAHPETLTLSALQALPSETVPVSFLTGRGEQKGVYTGARLWDVLKAAQVVDQGRGSMLRRTITIAGRDGYTIVIALSEIDPDYGNHPALLAYVRDGNPLLPKDGFRLVFPGDRHGGRAVSDVVKIDVQ